MWTLLIPLASACSCSGLVSFGDAALVAVGVFEGRVVAVTPEGGLEVEVLGGIDGPSGGRVRIWGDSGKSCRPSVALHRVGETYLFVAEPMPVHETQPGSQPGDWALPVCTAASLQVIDGAAAGSGTTKPVEVWMAQLKEGREARVMRRSRQLTVGTTAVVEGVRAAAKAGPVLLVEDVPVYVVGIEAWAEMGTTGRLRGSLTQEPFLPPPLPPTGAIQQGGNGEQWVLRVGE